jgi:hypothetical protein
MNFTVHRKEKTSLKFVSLFLFSWFVCLLFLSTPGFGATTTRICDQPAGARTRLIQSFGHRSTTLVGPVASRDAFVALFSQDKFLKAFHEVLVQACLENYESDILNAVKSGEITETTITSGTEMKWVAGRRSGRVKVSGPARYVGTRPAEAYQFQVKLGDNVYTFAAPKVCGNLLLLDVAAAPAPPAPAPTPEQPPPPPPAPAPACVLTITTVETGKCSTVEVRSDVAGTLEVQVDGAAVSGVDVPPRLNANEPVTLKLCGAGHYTARLTAENGAVCDAATDIIKVAPMGGPFVSGFFGKERRIHEEFLNGRCAPLVGVSGGYGFFVSDNVELAPVFGVAINTRDTENTAVFAELELNGHFGRGFVGAGIGVWDIFSDDDIGGRDGDIMGQFGIHLTDTDSVRISWVNQGRLFFDTLDDIENNYMFWTGLRFQFH